jgi:hypothetical protein
VLKWAEVIIDEIFPTLFLPVRGKYTPLHFCLLNDTPWIPEARQSLRWILIYLLSYLSLFRAVAASCGSESFAREIQTARSAQVASYMRISVHLWYSLLLVDKPGVIWRVNRATASGEATSVLLSCTFWSPILLYVPWMFVIKAIVQAEHTASFFGISLCSYLSHSSSTSTHFLNYGNVSSSSHEIRDTSNTGNRD